MTPTTTVDGGKGIYRATTPEEQQLWSLPAWRNKTGGGDGVPSTVATGVEVASAPVQPVSPLLVCMYRRADGWREGSCGVCLADLADGEAIRVLPTCMHYFRATWVGEWLRAHHTCRWCHVLTSSSLCFNLASTCTCV